MKRSTDRILTTHVGSLPRPDDLRAMIIQKQRGEPINEAVLASRVNSAVSETVRRQADAGIDIIADGEMGRIGFIPYVNERLTGIEPSSGAEPANYWNQSREYQAFPEFYAWATQMPGAAGQTGRTRWVCTGPVAYKGIAALQQDIATLQEALAGVRHEEAFMPAVSPSNLANWNRNEYYNSEEEYLYALADALHEEYRAIIDAGLVLQVDDPLLASYYVMHPAASVEDCRKWATTRVDALNHALRGLPADRIRYHTCYSINIGPRVHDMELKHIIDIMLRSQCRGVFVRGGQPAPRARMEGVAGGAAARRQVADPGGHHAFIEHRRALRTDCRTYRAFRAGGWARKCDRRRRLRFRELCLDLRGPSERRLGQAQGPGGRRAARQRRVVAASGVACRSPLRMNG